MGWSGGTNIVRAVAKVIKDNIYNENAKEKIYKVLVHEAEMNDWDCQDEAMGIDPILDKILKND
jgi:hypothetical protein